MRTLRLAFVSSLVLELLATLSVALVAVEVGLRLVGGGLDLRTALVVLILAPEVYLPLRQLGAQHHASADGVAAAGRVLDVLAEPLPEHGTLRVAAAGSLVLDEVTVRHPGRARPALDAIMLRVRPGEVVVLTGPSGCGKSTALHAILGFVSPTAGRVLVAGHDLTTVDIDGWRAQVAWVPQWPMLFPGTVADNIRLGDPGADDDRVRAAARDAGVEHLLSTVVNSAGASLSAGERQRVAVARAFLREAPVLLLDEPTAHLDRGTEEALVERIAEHCRSRTALIVAHHPALLRLADRVIELSPPATLEELPHRERSQPSTLQESRNRERPEPSSREGLRQP
jgi:ATP-binding cassette subfamily C protein CydCD